MRFALQPGSSQLLISRYVGQMVLANQSKRHFYDKTVIQPMGISWGTNGWGRWRVAYAILNAREPQWRFDAMIVHRMGTLTSIAAMSRTWTRTWRLSATEQTVLQENLFSAHLFVFRRL